MNSLQANLFLIIFGLILSFTTHSAEYTQHLQFERGTNSAMVEGAVIRGDRDYYLLRVSAGQMMTVSITSLEQNAVFAIYEPTSEQAIPGTSGGNDITEWRGILEMSGEYKIEVGGTRGNATYKLQVMVQ